MIAPHYSYRHDIPKTVMRRYAQQWEGLPMPRLQLRWAPKPVAKSDPAFAHDQRASNRICRKLGLAVMENQAWDCFYEMVIPTDRLDVRNEKYGVGFVLIPMGQTRRTGSPDHPPKLGDTPWRDGVHAFVDSKALGWLPIYSVAPDGSIERRVGYHGQPKEWDDLA